jgi:hypothetical protein
VEGENGKTAMPRRQANPANPTDTRCTSTQNIPKRNYELQEGKQHHQAAYFAKLTKAIRDLQNITTRKNYDDSSMSAKEIWQQLRHRSTLGGQ